MNHWHINFISAFLSLRLYLNRCLKSRSHYKKSILISSFIRAVETINQPEIFLLELESLGKKHQGMGIGGEHFKLVKSALILAIENILSNQCTKQIIQAWGNYIDQMSAVIKQQI